MYPINYAKPGKVVIFNYNQFKENAKLETRNGSDIDVERLSKIFSHLKFEIKTHLDKSSAETRNILKQYSQTDFKNDSCLIFFIMSHGNNGKIFASDGSEIDLNEFIDPFKSQQNIAAKTLKDKPKLFFIQACRMHGNASASSAAAPTIFQNEEADFLFSYSTIEGYEAIRHIEKGSWYIQGLCDLIAQTPNLDISQISVDLNSKVYENAKKFEMNSATIPTHENRLTKRLYLSQSSTPISFNSTGKQIHYNGRLNALVNIYENFIFRRQL